MGFLPYVPSVLRLANLILSSAIVIIASSLLIYILAHNLRSSVARSFCALIAFVIPVYMGDVALYGIDSLRRAIPWLKFQWIGIAFIPVAYLRFSDALLLMTNSTSRLRRLAASVGYFVSAAFLLLVIFTDLVVRDGVYSPWAIQFNTGPLFWAFALYFFAAVSWGAANISKARRRCLTSTSRRRMTYLAVSFLAPALGVFPYLLVIGMRPYLFPYVLQLITLVGNVGVAFMIVVMGYSVAYFGVLIPDRVVKHNLIHYLLRGPFVAICTIALILAIPEQSFILGLPRDTVLIFSVVSLIVFLQILINLAKPFIDQLVYRKDREEIVWIQELSKRLLTTTDLKQFLENLLTAICDLLRVKQAFVAVMAEGKLQVEAFCGRLSAIRAFLSSCDALELSRLFADGRDGENGGFVAHEGYWLLPLRTRTGEATLGIMGVEARSSKPDLTEEEREILATLVGRAEAALEDRHLQQGIFNALRHIISEIERIQRWRGTVRYADSPTLQVIEDNPIYAPDFYQMVKDAFSHYWGGPKLAESPLLRLRVVRKALEGNGGNPIKALRSVLYQALEAIKPEGERSMTKVEWTLYNILDLKFLQGLRAREVAARLAMSESDLYRKQRVAIEEVAKVIADMERKVRA